MANHRGQTYTAVHGKSAKQRRDEARTHKLQQKQYKNFGKVNWDYFSHRQMWDMVQSAKPQTMYNKADDWSTLATDIQSTTRGVQGTMQKLMTTWRGSAAVTASESNSRLTQWGGEAGNTAVEIGTGLKHYADAVSHAQSTIPEPVDYVAEQRLAEGYAVNVTDPEQHAYLLKHLADDHMATREQAKTAKAKAIQVMSGYEDRSHDVHEKLPEFQKAPSMAPHGGTAVPPTSQSPGGGGSQTPPPNVPTGPGTNSPSTLPGTGDGTNTGPASTTPSFAQPPTLNGGNPTTGYPNSTAPGMPGTAGMPGGGPGSNYPTANGPGGLAGFGGRPGIGPGGAAAASESAAGVRPGAGALGGAAAAEEAAAARGAAGRGGGAGMGGMPMGGGSGARGEGDGEHHNKYDDGLDLFDDIPPAYPSVFGE